MTRPRFDPLIHPEQRLRICAYLLSLDEVVFGRIREHLGCSDSVLSKHLKTLSDAGYVQTKKEPDVPRPRTWVSLTSSGRSSTRGHLAALQDLASEEGPVDAMP